MRLLYLVVLVLAAAGACRADQVVLDNGDRLTGTAVRLADGKLVINTEYTGDVEVDVKRIASLRVDSPMTVVLDDDTRLYGRLSGDAHKLQIAEAEQSVDMARVSAAEPGRVTGKEWKFWGAPRSVHRTAAATPNPVTSTSTPRAWRGKPGTDTPSAAAATMPAARYGNGE